MPVSCYICGRDFGTKSISIHIPNCIKKWETEQKKLPKSQRRPPPSAPVGLDKVISGELRGEELYKFNGEVLQEWNSSALVPCNNCSRTFLPSSLQSHQKSCTQERPMVKQPRDQSYTARANAKVSYPKLKGDKVKLKEEEIKFERERPGTFIIETEEESPTRQEISDIINSSKPLARPEVRRELREILISFLERHSDP